MVDRSLRDFAEVASDWFWETDAKNRFTYLSQRVTEIAGVEPSQFLGRRPDQVATQGAHSDLWRAHEDSVNARLPFRDFIYSFRRQSDGATVWARLSGQPIFDAEGVFQGYRGVGVDVTDDVNARSELLLKEAMFSQVERMAQVGAWRYDLAEQRLTWSPQVFRIYELDESAEVSLDIALSCYQGEAREAVQTAMTETLRTGAPFDIVTEFVTCKGRRRWVRAIGEPQMEQGQAARLFGIFQDVTEEREQSARMRRLALHDGLTGLINRRCFQQRLSEAVMASAQSGDAVTLAVIDLDRLKEVNDSRGHAAGDELLQEIAKRLTRIAGERSLAARLGGDEFALMCRAAVGSAEHARVLEALQTVFDAPTTIAGQKLTVRGCIGVARWPDDAQDADALMRCADLALYEAKSAGRGRVRAYSTAMSEKFERRVALLQSLDGALKDDALAPFYQPIVCLRTGVVTGFEALIRWLHPTRGVLTAGAFADAFEDRDIGPRVTQRLLARACEDMANWRRAGLAFGRVAFNLTEADLMGDGFADGLERWLIRSGVSPAQIAIELTESTIIDGDRDKVRFEIDRIAEMGVALSLDDFGTGYASLTHLKALPVQTLKLDRSFVSTIQSDPKSLAIVRAVLSLCKDLGFTTVAEGVETVEQLSLLSELNCDLAQGFLFSPAVQSDAAPNLIHHDAARVWPRYFAEALAPTSAKAAAAAASGGASLDRAAADIHRGDRDGFDDSEAAVANR